MIITLQLCIKMAVMRYIDMEFNVYTAAVVGTVFTDVLTR